MRTVLRSTCSDAQCGFKALRREVAAQLLPLIEDDEWFFDTELLVVAQRMGMRIYEVPVDWVDDLDSRVDVFRTAWKDVRGVSRLARSRSRRPLVAPCRTAASKTVTVRASGPSLGADELTGAATPPTGENPTATSAFADELLRFAGVGVVSTATYLAAVSILQTTLGIYPANTLAVVVCSVGNTSVHHRMTCSAGGRLDRWRLATVGAALMAVSLGVTTAALAITRRVKLTDLGPELVTLTAANLMAAVVRFGILRTWIFRPRFGTGLGAAINSGAGGADRVSTKRAERPAQAELRLPPATGT